VLLSRPRRRVPEGLIPTSAQVMGPVSDAAAICSVDSVRSVSPEPLQVGKGPSRHAVLPQSGSPTGSGMVGLGRQLHKHH
jgi:phospholipase C